MISQPTFTEVSVVCPACAHANPGWRFYCEECKQQLRPGNYSDHPALSTLPARPIFLTVYAVLQFIACLICSLAGLWFLGNTEIVQGLFFVVLALLEGWLAWGLWQQKEWARTVILILLSLNTVLGVFTLLNGGMGGAAIGINGTLLIWFATHGEYFK